MSHSLEVCAKLAPEQRDAIIAKFCDLNPHWRGAHAADIIDTLDDTDSNLDAVEKAWENFPQFHKPGFGCAVRALVWSNSPVDEINLRQLLD